MNTAQIIAEIDAEIAKLTQAKALLTGANSPVKRGRPKGSKNAPAKGRMSPEGRARIAAAMKKRWAAKRKEAK